MSIIGLISGFFITKTIIANKAIRSQITKNNMETISMALASFVANNNRLPRPSFDNNGEEHSLSEENLSNFVGKVPFHSLGIAAKTSLDGYGKPLIYAVEPSLTSDNFTKIYDDSGFDQCFCSGISDPKIYIKGIASTGRNPIAFVIDTSDNSPNVSEKINVVISKNTCWILRDMLLMQYLKNSPCRRETQTPAVPAPPASSSPFDSI